MNRRIVSPAVQIAVTLALTTALLTTGAGPASAATTDNCYGYPGARIVSANLIKHHPSGLTAGVVQLCKTPAGYYFGYAKITSTFAVASYGHGFLRAWPNGTASREQTILDCNAAGGTGQMHGDRKTCRTPLRKYTSAATYRADGYMYDLHDNPTAYGATARTR